MQTSSQNGESGLFDLFLAVVVEQTFSMRKVKNEYCCYLGPLFLIFDPSEDGTFLNTLLETDRRDEESIEKSGYQRG